jgi:hypothetical protein
LEEYARGRLARTWVLGIASQFLEAHEIYEIYRNLSTFTQLCFMFISKCQILTYMYFVKCRDNLLNFYPRFLANGEHSLAKLFPVYATLAKRECRYSPAKRSKRNQHEEQWCIVSLSCWRGCTSLYLYR